MKLEVLIFLVFIPITVAYQCGTSNQATAKYGSIIGNFMPDENTNRILGGDQSVEGRWPWLATVINKRCSASIIGERWILTAAHCVLWNMYATYGSRISGGGIFDHVIEIHAHPDYVELQQHDIALLKLKHPITFREDLSPICLWKNDKLEKDELLVAAGWGSIFSHLRVEINDTSLFDELPSVYEPNGILNEGIITVKNDEECLEVAKNNSQLRKIVDKEFQHMICHHGINSGLTYGDSGGPSMTFRNGKWIQVGVASWIAQDRRINNRLDLLEFSFHTRVSYYCDWIAKITKGEVVCQDDPVDNPTNFTDVDGLLNTTVVNEHSNKTAIDNLENTTTAFNDVVKITTLDDLHETTVLDDLTNSNAVADLSKITMVNDSENTTSVDGLKNTTDNKSARNDTDALISSSANKIEKILVAVFWMKLFFH
uniref:Peptidase S1 domain-containing protein n=1 Tax=Panagrolaimus sp. JU765 TaxID=591449 RepID=A0AC34RIB5_9BILA